MLKSFILSVISLSLLAFTGCQSSSVQLFQAISATQIATTTTDTLLVNKTINKNQATSIYNAVVTVEAAEKLWDTAINTNSTADIVNDTAAVLNDLITLQNQLAAVQTQASTKKTTLSKTATANVSITQIENILVTVLELAPDISAVQNFIDTAFSLTSVTPAQITTAFTDLDQSEASLLVDINAPPTTASTGVAVSR